MSQDTKRDRSTSQPRGRKQVKIPSPVETQVFSSSPNHSKEDWAKLGDDIPPEFRYLNEHGHEYDQSLINSMELVANPKVPPQPTSADSSVSTQYKSISPESVHQEASKPDPILIFKARWGQLRKDSPEPKTTMTVIKNMRIKCLRDSGIIEGQPRDLLDQNWDMLGTDRVCTFISQFLVKKPDPILTTTPGPLCYLKGMVDSMRSTQSDLFVAFMEAQANVTADMRLASDAIKTFNDSVQDAEGIWREQSSICSKYLSNLESQLKLIKLQAETPIPPRGTESIRSSSLPTTNSSRHYPFIYQKIDGELQVTFDGQPTQKERFVLNQVNFILNALEDGSIITKVHPEMIYSQFQTEYVKHKDPRLAMQNILQNLK